MKTIFLLIVMLLNYTICLSQEISGVAEYTIRENSEDFANSVLNDPDMDPNMRKFIESKMETELTKNYQLTFTGNLSKFEEIQKVTLENQDADLSWSPYGIDVAIYKDLVNKAVIKEIDLMGKVFFVKDSESVFKWQLTDETKMIGGKRCNKATLVIPVSEEEAAAYQKEKAKYAAQSTQFFTLKEPVEKNIIAWYSPEIAVINGPLEYGGLPGLILQVNDGESIILCTKIKIETKSKGREIVTLPSKTITKDKFNEISQAKLKEIEDQN